MDKQLIIYYLQNKDLEKNLWKRAKDVRQMIFELQEEKESFRNEILYNSQVQVKISDQPRSNTNAIKDINDVIEQTDKRFCAYEKELLHEYAGLLDQLDVCKRVMLAYRTLLPIEREIVKRLYIQNEKWVAVETDLHLNHRILVQNVKDIFATLSEKIDSGLSNIELARQQNTYRLLRPTKTKGSPASEQIKGQKNVYDYFSLINNEKN